MSDVIRWFVTYWCAIPKLQKETIFFFMKVERYDVPTLIWFKLSQ